MAKAKVIITGDSQDAQRSVSRLNKKLNDARDASRKLLMGLSAAAVGAVGFAIKSIQLAGQMEQTEVAFTSLTGSAENAEEVLTELRDFAATTPFQFPGIAQSTRLLIAMGMEAGDATDAIKIVSDAVAAAGGGQEELNGVARALGQMQAKGKASAEELMQLAERGIPAQEILAEKLEMSGEEIANIGDHSIASAEVIEALLEGLADRFEGTAKEQSNTILGIWSTFKDNVTMTLIPLGDLIADTFNIKDVLRTAIEKLTDFRESLEDIRETIDKEGLEGVIEDLFPEDIDIMIIATAGAITGALVPAFIALGAAVWKAMAPLLPFMAAGAALGVLAYTIYNNWEEVIGFFKTSWASWVASWMKTKAGILLGWEILKKGIYDSTRKIMEYYRPLQNLPFGIGEKFKAMFETMGNKSSDAEENIKKLKKEIDDYDVIIDKAAQATNDAVIDVTDGIDETLKNVFNNVKDMVIGLMGLGGAGQEAGSGLEELGEGGEEGSEGLDKAGESGEKTKEKLTELEKILKDVTENMNNKLALVTAKSEAFGDSFNETGVKASIYKDAIEELLKNGIDPQNKKVQELIAIYNELTGSMKENKGNTFDMQETLDTMTSRLEILADKSKLFGDEVDYNSEKSKILKDTIIELITNGIDPNSKKVQELIQSYNSLETETEDVADKTFDLEKAMENTYTALGDAEDKASVFGEEVNLSSEKATILKSAIISLIKNGIDPNNARLQELVALYNQYNDTTEESTTSTISLQEIMTNYNKELGILVDKNKAFGESFDFSSAKAGLLQRTINTLIENGINPNNTAVVALVAQYNKLINTEEETKQGTFSLEETLTSLNEELVLVDKKGQALGKRFDKNKAKTNKIKGAIIDLVENGIDPESEAIQTLIDLLDSLQDTNKKTISSTEMFKQKYGQKIREILDDVRTVTGMITNVFNQQFRAREQKLDNYYQKNKKNIEDSLMSEEDKAEAIKNLEEDVEKKRKKIARERAKREKKVAIMEAIVNTASAIVQALPNIPLSIIVGGLGAAQIAAIQSTPLPELAEGGFLERAGRVLVGERGPEILNLPRGAEVRPLDKANKIFNMPITITGNTIASSMDINNIGNQLVNKLQAAGVKIN